MAEHTPGPWAYTEKDAWYEGVSSKDGWICSIGHDHAEYKMGRYAEVQANARLIAAAPDLLAALEAILEIAEDCYHDHHGLCQAHNLRRNEQGEPECQYEMARAAIRKARGDDND